MNSHKTIIKNTVFRMEYGVFYDLTPHTTGPASSSGLRSVCLFCSLFGVAQTRPAVLYLLVEYPYKKMI